MREQFRYILHIIHRYVSELTDNNMQKYSEKYTIAMCSYTM